MTDDDSRTGDGSEVSALNPRVMRGAAEQVTVELSDRCASFCVHAPARPSSDLHGAWCRSLPFGREISAYWNRVAQYDRDSDPERVELTIEVVRPYLAGRFPRHDLLDTDRRRVLVTVQPADPTAAPKELYLETGDARRLVASLQRAADLGDELP